MEITSPELESADRIVDLWVSLAAGQQEHGSHLLAEENRRHIRESIVRRIVTDRVLVAREDSILGFVMFTIQNGRYEEDLKRGVIENLYVVPDYRSAGIGSMLLETAEQHIQEAGVDVVALEVMAANELGREFYREHGYVPHRVEFEKHLDGLTEE
ncbi:GNAT family N-acetyltransferase [Halobacteriales archaeon QH_2_65_14]|nr:MAG: GNAT family N-acetyltransferase [Halobacteriales archaeon QH_2_65_14]